MNVRPYDQEQDTTADSRGVEAGTISAMRHQLASDSRTALLVLDSARDAYLVALALDFYRRHNGAALAVGAAATCTEFADRCNAAALYLEGFRG